MYRHVLLSYSACSQCIIIAEYQIFFFVYMKVYCIMHEMHNFHVDNIKVFISEVTVNDFIVDEYTLQTD